MDRYKIVEEHFDLEDKWHKTDGPAVVYADGRTEWYWHGKLHREDGPAIEDATCKTWYTHGVCKRLDGPAVEFIDGYKAYRVDGVLHRVDGPAVEGPEGESWYINGMLHNLAGPAVRHHLTNAPDEYWIDGVFYTKEKFDKLTSA
jgi:hypothetical protein